MIDYQVGDLVYKDKYHRGALEIVEVLDEHIIVGKYSRFALLKSSVRHATQEEILMDRGLP